MEVGRDGSMCKVLAYGYVLLKEARVSSACIGGGSAHLASVVGDVVRSILPLEHLVNDVERIVEPTADVGEDRVVEDDEPPWR